MCKDFANLLIHREYKNSQPATFIIYTDRVETKNANKPHLLGKLIPGNFEPYPKNPNLAKFFVQMARAEDLGTAISNVYKYLKLYSNTAPEFNEEQLFKVTIPILHKEKVGEKVGEKLTENQNAILQIIDEDNRISARLLAKKIGISQRKVEENIRKLKEKGVLERIGPDKGGHWRLIQ